MVEAVKVMDIAQIKRLLPNAQAVDFLDCKVIVDKNGKEIGYWDDGFYLNEGYEFGQVVYERFMGEGIVLTKFYISKQYD